MRYNPRCQFMQGEDVGNIYVPADEDLRGENSAYDETDSRPFDTVEAVTSQPGSSTPAPLRRIDDVDKLNLLCAMLGCINIIAGSYLLF
jgi:hypothetical protein